MSDANQRAEIIDGHKRLQTDIDCLESIHDHMYCTAMNTIVWNDLQCLAQINAKASLTIKHPMVDNIAELTSSGVGDLRAGIVLM